MKRSALLRILLVLIFFGNAARAQWLASSDTLMSDIRGVVSNGSYLFAGAYAGVYRSGDNGSTWTSVLKNVDVRGVVAIGSSVFAGTYGYGVYRSTDNGATWVPADSGLTNHNTACLVSNGSVLLAGSSGAIQRSTDNGATWGTSDAALAGANITTIAFTGSAVLAGASANVWFSTNGGVNWTQGSFVFMGSVGAFQSLGSHLFAATVAGAYRSTDNGQNWSPIDSGITGLSATALAVSGSTLFMGTFGGGVFRSTNDGGNWTAVNTGLSYFTIDCLYVNGGYIYAGTGGSVAGIWHRPLSQIATSVTASPRRGPGEYQLEQNFPNPFNPSTVIRYSLPAALHVTLSVYNALGELVATLVNADEQPGEHSVRFDGTKLASGSYFYRLQAGSFAKTMRLMMIR